MKISVIGLGKLGLPLAAHLGNIPGNEVTGYDKDENLRDRIRTWKRGEGPCPVHEPGMDELRDFFRVESIPEAGDATFIVVPTPSCTTGSFSNARIFSALEDLASSLRSRTMPMVVLVSTVSPYACQKTIIPKLEQLMGGVNGQDFDFVYNPEFISLGNILADLESPDFVLVGYLKEREMDVYKTLSSVLNQNLISMMSYTEAELAKLALNCCVTQKMCFANAVGHLCDRFGADANLVLGAIGNDSRIGHRYLVPGTPFGGPCFPRDGHALQHACRAVHAPGGVEDFLVAPSRFRTWQLAEQARAVRSVLSARGRVVVCGTSYKDGHPSEEEAAGRLLCDALERTGHEVIAANTEEEALAGADRAEALAVMLPGLDFDWRAIVRKLGHGAMVYAPWGEPDVDECEDAPVFYSRGFVP